MARISGMVIPDHKKINIALTYIYGIGPVSSQLILKSAGINSDKKAAELTAEEINKIQNIIDKNFQVGGELKREIAKNIQRLREIGSWRGMRHSRRLPIHGRTKTNSRTTRGNVRKTMGSGRKSSTEKT
ncbi:MAG: small subunit ribosomal protein S13 [Parcubacteria group bacterium Gr01-1014_44]|nr:MAG: small subunit ribosomal protein S13 [Parcubacteria group bacterium Gr01-1014_44]